MRTGVPPEAGTWKRPQGPSEITIVPFELQALPNPYHKSQMLSAGPPAAGILRNLPSAEKKAMNWLSGDQKGKTAPSVPSSGWATSLDKERSQSFGLPSASVSVISTRLPSGDKKAALSTTKLLPGG